MPLIVSNEISDLEELAAVHGDAAGLSGYTLAGRGDWPFVMLEEPGAEPYVAFGRFCDYHDGGGKRHTVGLFYGRGADGTSGFRLVCDEKFLTGCYKDGRTAAARRVTEAVATAFAEGLVSGSDSVKLQELLLKSYGVFSRNSPCNFWRAVKGGAVGCRHVKGFLAHRRLAAELETWAQEVRDGFDNLFASPVAVTTAIASSAVFDRLAEDLAPSREFKVPILVEGAPGWGKTHAARELGMTGGFGCFVECQGHSGMESVDFLGGFLRCGNEFVWCDGPVTRAFRAAAAGEKTLLLIDELLRIPKRERNVFLSALSPHKGRYRLATGRAIMHPDGIAQTELIEAPVSNLSIVGTTNVGADYSDIEMDDPALTERFVYVRIGKDRAFAEKVLCGHVKSRGWSTRLVPQMLAFFDGVEALARLNHAASSPSLRMLCRAVEMASAPEKVKDRLGEMISTWVGRELNGEPVPEQVKGVRKVLAKAFV